MFTERFIVRSAFALRRTPALTRSTVIKPSLFQTRYFTSSPLAKMNLLDSVANATGATGLMSNRYKVEDMPDLTGKIAVVTGGSAGIGQAAVKALVKKGCEVHILSSSEEHANETMSKISEETPNAKSLIKHHQVDLGHISSVSSLASSLNSSLSRIDILLLIAGIGVAPFGHTQDGLPNHFAVNHLSHMVIVDSVLPKMKETAKSKVGKSEAEWYSTRIVLESSELHRASPSDVKFANLEELDQDIDETKLYGRSKLMNLLFARELANHHLPALSSSTPIMSLATHPGAVATEQQKGATEAYGMLGKALESVASYTFMAPEQGAESALWAGTAPSVSERRVEVNGRYFTEADGKVGTESSQGQSDELAKNLWDLSVKVLQDKGYTVKM